MDPLYQTDLAYIHAAGYSGLARRAGADIIRRLKAASTPIHHVIDVGCGSGPLSAELCAAGFQVTGIDPSNAFLELAREAAPGATFLQGSIYEMDLPRCEAIVAVCEPLTYHEEGVDAPRRLLRLFERAAEFLPRGGMLIFDVIETGDPNLTGRNWTSGDDWAVLVESIDDSRSRTLIRTIETFVRSGELYRRTREVHRVHLFDPTELRAMLTGCGFEVETADCYGSEPLSTRRMAYFCTR
ncbi:MAG: class I SAM-dependent methyltransferase [Bryobacterales bacterium]|nr:class I SAM-dependent methyltransferase [Bryobacterales bacterium]